MIRFRFASRACCAPRSLPLGASLLVVLLALPAWAGAQSEAELQQKMQQMEQMQRQMEQQMQAMARQLESLKTELAATRSELADQQTSVAAADESESPPTGPEEKPVAISLNRGHLTVTSADGDFEVGIGGRLQVDTAVFDEDEGSVGNGTEIRRARLFVAGKFNRDWAYKQQIDFAGDEVSIKDSYLRYTGLPARVTIGHFKEPFSLEELTSDKYLAFMERGLPNVFAPSRNLGIGADISGALAGGGGWSGSLGVFGEGVDDSGVDGDSQREDDEGMAVTGRLTAAPIATADRLVHFGGAASYRDTGDGTDMRLRQRFEAHIADRRLVDTGGIDNVDALIRTGAEAALAWGPWAFQGEYMRADLQRSGRPDVDFSGYYLLGSWFLTGESQASFYSPGSGIFGRIKPRAPLGTGIGAWQLAARFSQLDLTDRGIVGGKEENLTVGLNWFPLANLRFSANYVQVLDVTGGPNDGDEPAAFQMRAQVDF
ncbi:MAG: porin [Wenzhouxiangellaceae bacterium]|nr:porin [Wenzhouxiangellaceae bacterium]